MTASHWLITLGKVPPNMSAAWKFLLQKSTPPLPTLRFAVFGFGDSGYEKFNAAARKLYTRLQQLQAQPVLPLGLGDDQHPTMYLQALDEWTRLLFRHLDVQPRLEEEREPLYRIDFPPVTTNGPTPLSEDFVRSFKDATIHPDVVCFRTEVVSNRLLTRPGWEQEVRLVTLQLPQPVPYTAGDVAAVYPRNPQELVERALSLLGLQSNSLLSIARTLKSHYYGNRVTDLTCSATELFQRYLDIGGRPKRSFFESIAQLATDSEERSKLLELSSPTGCDLFVEYCLRENRNYVEVLEEFPSVNFSLHACLALIPTLRPRYFSIASTSRTHPLLVQLCVGKVQYQTPYKRVRRGRTMPSVSDR